MYAEEVLYVLRRARHGSNHSILVRVALERPHCLSRKPWRGAMLGEDKYNWHRRHLFGARARVPREAGVKAAGSVGVKSVPLCIVGAANSRAHIE